MKYYILVVAILAFSTLIDAATFTCYKRDSGASGEGTQEDCDDTTQKCIAYYDALGKNIGACVATAGACTGKTGCKECTSADCNKRATIFPKCWNRIEMTTGEGKQGTACTGTPADAKCVSYYDASGYNNGKCLDGGCSHLSITGSSLHCKECFTDNCNFKLIIRKCYVRTTLTTSGDGTSTNCPTTMYLPKCVSYFDADGNNIGKCKSSRDGGCGSQANCQECTSDNCNVRALIFPKCYKRESTDAAPAEGTTDTACTGTPTDAKCVSYYDAAGNNLGKCLDGGCSDSSVSSLACKDCFTDNCNIRSIVTTTTSTTTTTAAPTTTAAGGAAPTTAAVGAAPTTTAAGGAAPTTPCAAATRASVGWQTGIMAASACVLALMKPF